MYIKVGDFMLLPLNPSTKKIYEINTTILNIIENNYTIPNIIEELLTDLVRFGIDCENYTIIELDDTFNKYLQHYNQLQNFLSNKYPLIDFILYAIKNKDNLPNCILYEVIECNVDEFVLCECKHPQSISISLNNILPSHMKYKPIAHLFIPHNKIQDISFVRYVFGREIGSGSVLDYMKVKVMLKDNYFTMNTYIDIPSSTSKTGVVRDLYVGVSEITHLHSYKDALGDLDEKFKYHIFRYGNNIIAYKI